MNQAAVITENLQEGQFAPDFMAQTDGGGVFSLSALRGNKHVVLYFYPKDDTPGCTLEAKEFNEIRSQIEQQGAVLIGISRDDVVSHEKFKAKYCLGFALGVDDTGSICEAYGSWVEKNMYGKKYMGIQRDTFLIDKQGKIARIWRKVKPEGHASEVLNALRAL